MVLFIALTTLFCSCSQNSVVEQVTEDKGLKSVRIISAADSVITKVSQIATDVEYIPLQTSPDTEIKGIVKIVTRGHKIYVNLITDILCFDEGGHLLYQLFGNGDNAGYNQVAIYDFDIDTADTTLIVLAGKKILHFKITNTGFDYVKTIGLGRMFSSRLDFVPGTSKFLLSFNRRKGNEPFLSVLIDINGEMLTSKPNYFKRFNPVNNHIRDTVIHYQYGNKLYFRERLNDTVFSVDSESDDFTPAFMLDSRLSSTNSENINDPQYFKLLPLIKNICESPRYIYYTSRFSRFNYSIFYDKFENKKYMIDLEKNKLEDDISGGPDLEPEFICEGKMYLWISNDVLRQHFKTMNLAGGNEKDLSKNEKIKKLIQSVEGNDNSFLVCVDLKK